MADNFIEEYSGSIFWLLLTFITLLGLILLFLLAFREENLQAAIIAVIFFAMIMVGLILAIASNKKLYDLGSWSQSSIGFSIAFIFYYILSGSGKSVLAVTENPLFASVSSELPRGLSYVMNIFVIPFAEEVLWIIGIPYTLMALLDLLGKKYKIFSNLYVQLAIIGLIAGATFALFHLQKLVLYFLVGALLFRLITIWAVLGEQKGDWIKWLMIPPAAAIGAHMGNNMSGAGFFSSFSTVYTYNPIVAVIMFGFLGIVFLSAVNGIIEFLNDKVFKIGE